MSFLKDALNYTKGIAEAAVEAVADAAEKVKEADLIEKAKDIGGAAKDIGGNLYQHTKDAAEVVRDKAVETGEAITSTVQAHKPDFEDIARTSQEKAREMIDKIKKM